MTRKRILHFVITIVFLFIIGCTSANRAAATNSLYNKGKGASASTVCLPLPVRPNFPVVTLPADFIQFEGGQLYLDNYFIPNQIILSGNPVDIDSFFNLPSVPALGLTQIAGSNLGLPFGGVQNEMQLFSTPNATIPTLHDIYDILDQNSLDVMAEPNRIVANPWGLDGNPWGLDGNPWGLDGNPWGLDGNPWGIDGDPWGLDGNSAIQAIAAGESRVMPLNQWAIAEGPGIGLINQSGVRNTQLMGDDADVFIFDTTPYQNTGNVQLYGSDMCSYNADLPIQVNAPHDGVREHGVFAAGLVKMVAPFSNVHLVRSLNEAGFGDIFSVVVAMQDSLQEQHNQQRLEQTIFNLSMSIVEVDENTSNGQAVMDINQRINNVQPRLSSQYHSYVADNEPIPALRLFAHSANSNGVTILAAAGNDSADGDRQSAGIPAAYDTTIGVAASNVDGDISCFSNAPEERAILFAPGGDGLGDDCENPLGAGDFWSVCGGTGISEYDCDYTVMSATSTGYSHWVGTSFSTPLAAGTAALAAQFNVENGCNANPDVLKQAMLEAADNNDGRVDVALTVDVFEGMCNP